MRNATSWNGHPPFATSTGLRAVLVRLAEHDGWRHDPEAAELMRWCANKYAGLARKHRQHPDDAAAAAFEAMRNPSTRRANDPWAVVTTAVRITLAAQHRADQLLTSTQRARRHDYAVMHDPQRFSDRDTPPLEVHPALASPDPHDRTDDSDDTAAWLVTATTALLTWWGWPAATTRTAVHYVANRLGDIGERAGAYEVLRRDKAMRAALDLPQHAWTGLLRLTLGHHTATGRLRHGLFARLLAGDPPADLRHDPALGRAAMAANPTPPVGPGRRRGQP